MSTVSSFTSSEQGKTALLSSELKIQKETLIEYLRAFGYNKTLSESEQSQFIQTALANNLDPFKREIHIAVYSEGANRKVSIITGYQIYLKRAERTGRLDGWRAWLEGEGSQMKAVVEIFRKDWKYSFTHEVYFEETVQRKKDGSPTQFWAKQPRFQLRKVAMAQAFRLAFPDELGGLPYEPAELPDSENTAGDSAAPAMQNNAPQNVKTSIHEYEPPNTLAEEALDDKPQNVSAEQQASCPASSGDYLEETIHHIEELFEAHPADFTKKHQAWILDKVHKASDNTGIQKMLAYTEKVIRQAA
jgi:phage recombination protein Bet